MTTKNLIPRASGEGGIGITDVTWGHGYYDTGNFNKGLFVSGHNITQVIAETVTQGGLGGEWERNVLDIYYNGGNVGIGTTTPDAPLHVISDTAANALSLTRPIDVLTNPGAASKIIGGALATTTPTYGGAIGFASEIAAGVGNTSGLLYFETKDPGGSLTEKMRISSNGHVGIGTSNPSLSLDISTTSGSANEIKKHLMLSRSTTNGAYLGTIRAASTNDVSGLVLGVDSQNILIIKDNGHVGIGTSNPSSKFVVQGDNADIFLKSTNGTASVSLIQDPNGHGKIDVMNDVGNTICHFDSNGNSFIKNGNVGIGTSNPSVNLETQKNNNGASQPLLVSNYDSTFDSVIATSSIAFGLARNGASPGLQGSQISDIGLITVGKSNIWDTNDQNLKSYMAFSTADGLKTPPLVTPIERMRIDSAGNVHIKSNHALNDPESVGLGHSVHILNTNGNIDTGSSLFLGSNSNTGAGIYAQRTSSATNEHKFGIGTRNSSGNWGTKVTVLGNGRVGIGTTAPGAELDVVGRVSFSKIPCNNNAVPASLFTGAAMSFLPASSTFGTGKAKDIGIAFQSLHGAGGTGKGETDLVLGTVNPQGSNQEIMKLHSDGRVRIGRKSSENSGLTSWGALLPGGSLEIRAEEDVNAANAQLRIVGGNGLGTGQAVTGSLYIDNTTIARFFISQDIAGGEIHVVSSSGGVKLASGATNWVSATSDRRAKENISPLENVLEKVLKLSPSRFDFKEEYGNKDQIGFIAQDVNEVLPEFHIPGETEEEMSTVKFSDTATTALLVKAIQEQQQIIEDLKSRIETLENK